MVVNAGMEKRPWLKIFPGSKVGSTSEIASLGHKIVDRADPSSCQGIHVKCTGQYVRVGVTTDINGLVPDPYLVQ